MCSMKIFNFLGLGEAANIAKLYALSLMSQQMCTTWTSSNSSLSFWDEQ